MKMAKDKNKISIIKDGKLKVITVDDKTLLELFKKGKPYKKR